MSKKRLTSSDEAKPSDVQIREPCHDCPFLRTAIPGWLGGATPREYMGLAHSEQVIQCHALIGPQCAGAAIYRANNLKRPRNPEVLILPKDTVNVFATPLEFLAHHEENEDE